MAEPATPRAYLAVAGLVCVLALAAAAAVNTVVDPYDTIRLVDLPGWTDRKPVDPIGGGRAILSLRLGRGDHRGVIAGTSRELLGFARRDPVVVENGLVNAALAGTSIRETAAVLDFAAEHGDLELAIVGLDFIAFRRDKGFGGDYAESGFAGRPLWRIQLERLVSGETLVESFQTVRASRAGDGSPRGLPTLMTGETRNRFTKNLLAYARKHYACFEYDPTGLAELGRAIDALAARGARVLLFFSPVHATQLDALRAARLSVPYRQWRTDVVRAVATARDALPPGERERIQLWDFTGYGWYTTQSISDGRASRWHFESSHFRPALGALVLKRLLGDPDAPTDFGVRIDPETFDAHARRQAAEHVPWARKNRDDAKLVRRVFRSTEAERAEMCGARADAG